MTDSRTTQLQIARLYFESGATKADIARRLGISRFKVARLIDDALDTGLVRIEFREAPVLDRHLAREIEDAYGLKLCVVTRSAPDGLPSLGTLVQAAADLVLELISPGDVIGASWGKTITMMIEALPLRAVQGLRVVQLCGGSTRFVNEQGPLQVARNMAERLGGTYYPLYAPAYVAAPAVRNGLLDDPEFRETFELMDRLTLAVVGIGAVAPTPEKTESAVLRSGVVNPAEVNRLVAEGAVGDSVLYFFRKDGVLVGDWLAARAIGIDAEQLRRTPRVVAIAGGAPKAEAIEGAIRAGFVDILVTDQAAARALVKAARQDFLPRAKAAGRS